MASAKAGVFQVVVDPVLGAAARVAVRQVRCLDCTVGRVVQGRRVAMVVIVLDVGPVLIYTSED